MQIWPIFARTATTSTATDDCFGQGCPTWNASSSRDAWPKSRGRWTLCAAAHSQLHSPFRKRSPLPPVRQPSHERPWRPAHPWQREDSWTPSASSRANNEADCELCRSRIRRGQGWTSFEGRCQVNRREWLPPEDCQVFACVQKPARVGPASLQKCVPRRHAINVSV